MPGSFIIDHACSVDSYPFYNMQGLIPKFLNIFSRYSSSVIYIIIYTTAYYNYPCTYYAFHYDAACMVFDNWDKLKIPIICIAIHMVAMKSYIIITKQMIKILRYVARSFN